MIAEIVLTSIASVNENAKARSSNDFTDLADSVHRTRAVVLPDEDQLHSHAPNSRNARTVEFDSDGGTSQNDAAQPRSRIPPVMIYPPPPPPPISIAEMNIPPPPPPPMDHPFELHSSLAPIVPRDASLDKLDNEQQSLRDLRDKLVGARFTVAAKRKELRDLQIETAAKDGHAFNLLRQYLNEIGADVPPNISRALADASSLRDRLGPLEVDYDEAEARFNTLEWRYSRRETRFVEEVLNNKLVPSETLDRSQSAENLEILQLTRSMERPNDDSFMSSVLPASSDQAGVRSIEDLSAFLAEQGLVVPHSASIGSSRPRSFQSNLSALALVRPKSANEIRPIHDQLRWVENMSKIDGWLFDTVDASPVQKLGLKAMQDFGFADTRTWWDHTKWLLIQDYSTYFHTGDSTVFNHTMGGHVSESTKEGLSSVSSIVEPCSTNHMLLGIQASDVPDPATLPSIIESVGYQETIDQAEMTRKLVTDTREEATSSAIISQSPRRRISHKSIVTDSGGSSHHYNHYQNYAHSRSLSDMSRYVEGAGREQISRNSAGATFRQRSGPQRPRKRNRLQKRHTLPEFKKAEVVEAATLPTNPNNTALSRMNLSCPIPDPESQNDHGKLSSRIGNTHRQCSESEQSSSSATQDLKPAQTKNLVLMPDRCLVM
jgi:hypothetical protein